MKSYEKETSKAVGNPVDDSAASDSDEDEDTCSNVKVDGLEDSDKNSNSAVMTIVARRVMRTVTRRVTERMMRLILTRVLQSPEKGRTRRVRKKQKSVKDRAVELEDKNVAVREAVMDWTDQVGQQTIGTRALVASK